MPAIQSLGVGSGLDANSIVTQLLAIEKQPLSRLQKAANGIQAEISAFGNITSKLDSLETAAKVLNTAGTWTATKASSSDTSAITVTAANTAESVNLDIQVTTLAKAQSVVTPYLVPVLPATTYTVGTEQTLKIETGKWVAGSLTDATPVYVSLSGTDTLTDIKDKLNASGAGVTATILNDSGGSRIVIRSNETGTSNAFKISSYLGTVNSGNEASATLNSGSPLHFTNPASASFTQQATDLSATVNGAVVTSASNTMTDLVDGVTVTALKTTTSAAQVSVAKDLDSIKTKITAFASAYNDLMALLRQQTSYNESTKAGATLQGDRLAVSLQSQLRSTTLDSTAASGVFGRLSEVGIRLQRDGSLLVDSSVLETSLGNLDEMAELFSRDDASAVSDGVAVKLSDFIDAVTGSEGSLTRKTEGLRARLARNQDDQDRMNDRLALVEARLKAQYTALDEKMASLSGLSSYVSQQVQLLNGSSGRS